MFRDKDPVLFSVEEYRIFRNDAPLRIVHGGITYKTAAHFYNAQKVTDRGQKEDINNAPTATLAYQIAESYRTVVYSFDEKIAMMEQVLRLKLLQHDLIISTTLLSTGYRPLVEDSPENDFWGDGPDGNGQGWLPRLWMKLRAELQTGVIKSHAQERVNLWAS